MADAFDIRDPDSLTRFRLLGIGDRLVVFDSGDSDCTEIWRRVAPEFASDARILLVDREASGRGDLFTPEQETAKLIRQIHNSCSQQETRCRYVFVAWSRGSLIGLELARADNDRLQALVLIDPEFGNPLESPAIPPAKVGNSISSELPVTVILPGNQTDSADELVIARRTLQRHMLGTIPHRREIIAGRSLTCIPVERADVVIDAIRSYLSILP